jgi:hypothetical protein
MKTPPDVQINLKVIALMVRTRGVKIKAFCTRNHKIILTGFNHQYPAVFILLNFSKQCSKFNYRWASFDLKNHKTKFSGGKEGNEGHADTRHNNFECEEFDPSL